MGCAGAPLLPIAAALALGIALAPWLAIAPLTLMASGAALAVSVAAALAGRREGLALLALLGGAGVIGALAQSAPVIPADHIARRALPAPVAIEGRLVSEPVRWTPERARLLVDIEAYHDGADRRLATGRVQLTVFGETVPLAEGQRIGADVRLHRPIGLRNPGGFDYPAQLRRDGILLVGNTRGDRVTPLTPDTPPWPVAVKRWAVETIRARLPETSAALLAGLLLGERTALPRETDEAFRRAGVYHILAVSGFNVALLASSVFAALALLGVPRRGDGARGRRRADRLRPGRRRAALRAARHRHGPLLLLSVAARARVPAHERARPRRPRCSSLGVRATSATPASSSPSQRRRASSTSARRSPSGFSTWGWPAWLARSLAVSAGAQLAVTPIMLAHFNQLSLIGVVANLFVVPLAAPATTLGMLALLLVDLVSDTLAGLCFNALWLILLALRAIVWVAAAVPAAMVHLPAPPWGAVVAWYAALALAPLLGAAPSRGAGARGPPRDGGGAVGRGPGGGRAMAGCA